MKRFLEEKKNYVPIFKYLELIAVDNLCSGYDFYDVYKDLEERGFSREKEIEKYLEEADGRKYHRKT